MKIKSVDEELYCTTYEIPSTSSNTTISNASNMYKEDGYASIYGSGRQNSYCYIGGFDFSKIPANATVTSFSVSLRAGETGLSNVSSYAPKLCNGTSVISGECDVISGSASTYRFEDVPSWDTIKSYGSKFRVRINSRRPTFSRYSKSTISMYWVKISVHYTVPIDTCHIKKNGTWVEISKAYRKTNGAWKEIELADLKQSANYVKMN